MVSSTSQVAVVVDGANLQGIKHAFGAEFVSFSTLLWVAKQLAQISSIFPKPTATIHPHDCKRGCRLHDDYVRAGFDLIPVASYGGGDDELVVSRLLYFAHQPCVKVLVVVGCDHYEASELLKVARERRAEGNPLRGVLLGTTACDESGTPRTSPRVVERFERSRTVDFVDLVRWRAQLFTR